jgi:hypothetical protein
MSIVFFFKYCIIFAYVIVFGLIVILLLFFHCKWYLSLINMYLRILTPEGREIPLFRSFV